MGLRLSKYDMLHSLGYGKVIERRGDDPVEATIKILSRFKLFGLILHSPEGHPEFHQRLEKEFDHLDYLTGSHFLFFSLTKADKGKETGMDKEFMLWMGQEEEKKLLNPQNAYETKEVSLSAYTIAQSLGIDYDDLPVIVLTHDLQFNQYQVVKTCSQHLNEQLTEIGYFCSRTRRKFSIADDAKFKEMIRDIDLCGGNVKLKSEDSLAKTLADFLSFFLSDKVSNSRLKEIMSDYFFKIHNLDDPEKIERLKLFLFGCLGNIKYIRKMNPTSTILLDERCEDESKILINTFNKIYPLYKNWSLFETSYDIFDEYDLTAEMDYSLLILALSKVFELETNLSLVHWIRSYINIEMPKYYKKYKEDEIDYLLYPALVLVNGNPRPINFNMNLNGKWKAPGIGESELIMKTLYHENKYPENITQMSDLFKRWKIIRKYRNLGAHTKLLDQQAFNEVHNSFHWLIRSGKLKEMNDLKMKLKG